MPDLRQRHAGYHSREGLRFIISYAALHAHNIAPFCQANKKAVQRIKTSCMGVVVMLFPVVCIFVMLFPLVCIFVMLFPVVFIFVMLLPVVFIFVIILILMRFFRFFHLLGRQFYKLLTIAPAPVNGFNRLYRHKHRAVERCARARQNPMHPKRQIIMRRAIITQPML